MNAAVASGAAADGRRAITVAALLTTYMQAVTISLPNAALLYLQGTLSMADDEVGWVFTAYLAASAVTLPTARWLAGRYGRKTVYQLSIVIFVLGLVLATRAETATQFVIARVVQGGASGILGPLSIAILLDILPPPQHTRVNLMWSVTLMLGLLSGPSIGGWLSEYHGWHSIFYVSLPIAGSVFLAMALALPEKRAVQNPPFDFFGWATFSCGMIGLQMLLDGGERLEWFDSAKIWAEAIASVIGFYSCLVHVLTTKAHFLDKALFKDRNFVLSAIMYFAFGFVLLPTIALTSPMLDEILNYPADTTGYMAIPRSLALVGALILAGRIPARIDNRLPVAGGMALVIYGNWCMLGYSPLMDWWPVLIAGMFQGAGLGILLPTLTKAA
ncbi:MAG TPA: MFS transporter, partial [Xanthobacteraceae bacterium]|nr:MFS transporter [Xanthobacteraceae bacterium]